MKEITVVGAGIVGLTTAIALQEKGFKVQLLAAQFLEKTLSYKVGAIWFPFEVHPLEKAMNWGRLAYKRYQLDAGKAPGLSMIPFTVVCDPKGENAWMKHMPENSLRKAKKEELPNNAELAYVATVPLTEPPLYLPHLLQTFQRNGGELKEWLVGDLNELALLNKWVINCTGLGAKELCKDEELLPMRGQILRTEKLDIQSCVNSTQPGALSYIIQRSTDCIIGGTDYLNDWNQSVEVSDTELITNRFMAMGFSDAFPSVLEEVVGLRPRRKEVRFEFDREFTNVFHNYGHGGAGFTVAWGCALELAQEFGKRLNPS